MPNKRGGKRSRRYKKQTIKQKINFIEKDDNQVYAIVLKKMGGSRLQVKCSDGGKVRSAVIPGKFRKRIWINPGDILLCNIVIMGTRTNSCYIELKYDEESVSRLKRNGELDFIGDGTNNGSNIEFSNDVFSTNASDNKEKIVEPIDFDSV
uniref:Translation initiation factor n=1 Tax=Mimivirus LCMiAC01 TaxID=2506608 RepID=A0A481Z1U5_9VIRU|nr:MAG: translation initiation factor [Mimivirus LCMiAC01]